jgi:hypothetical protein
MLVLVLEKAVAAKETVAATAHVAADKAAEAAHVVQGEIRRSPVVSSHEKLLDKAAALKDTTVAAAQVTGEKAAEVAHTVQGKVCRKLIFS